MHRFVVWGRIDGFGAEVAEVELGADGIQARGTQLGVDYRLDYRLDATDGWATRSLELDARGDGFKRHARLERDGSGTWSYEGGEAADVSGALDCDVGFSPLTNMMPVRRHGLRERDGAEDFVMAWVSVPDLSLLRSAQRYEHVRPGVVRFVDRGLFPGFTAELELDEDGLVEHYPELARRVHGPAPG